MLSRLETDEEGIGERILSSHEAKGILEGGKPGASGAEALQMNLFDRLDNADQGLAKELKALNLDEVTPITAWRWLERIRKALD